MSDPESSRLPRGLPLGLLGMFALVAAVEWYLARHALDFGNVAALNWRSAEALARKAGNCEVLCLGSSLTTNGVLPRVLEDRLGKPACNLAVFGGSMPVSYFLLKRALESGARPKVVVLDCQDNPVEPEEGSRYDDLWKCLRQWRELLTLREGLDLAWTARDPSFFGALVVSKALPSARARYEVRVSVVRALQGKPLALFIPLTALSRNWRMHRGAQVLPASGKDRETTAVPAPYPGRRERWVSNAVCRSYTRRMMDLLARHGIAVFWTFPPIGPQLTAWREENGLDDFATRSAEAVQSRFPRVTLVDGRRAGYPARIFNDGLHLGRPGAVAYSRDLASILARYFGEPSALPKSVVLPPYRGRDMPLEDIYESGEVVRLAYLRRLGVVR